MAVNVKVLIVDDHKLFLDGLQQVLRTHRPDLDIFTASSTREALVHLQAMPDIDLVLLDLTMPGLDGISCLKAVKEWNGDTRVIIISAVEDPASVRETFANGASGFIPKSYSVDKMQQAMDMVMRGKRYIPTELTTVSEAGTPDAGDDLDSRLDALNLREKQLRVLEQMAGGLTVDRIAENMDISPNTVKSHIKIIYQALNVNSRVAAVIEGKRLNILE